MIDVVVLAKRLSVSNKEFFDYQLGLKYSNRKNPVVSHNRQKFIISSFQMFRAVLLLGVFE